LWPEYRRLCDEVPERGELEEMLHGKPYSEVEVSEHLQEFAKIYLANPVFCQLLKSYAK
jgi:hypothetical protein